VDKIITPVVSVLMPVFNCQQYISESIYSILNQSFHDFELIIIDDASTDRTVKVIQNINDNRIQLIQKKINSGYTNSLNIGIKLCKGRYIARMDGDDISLPLRFETQVRYLDKQKDVAVCGTWIQFLETEEIVKYPVSSEDVKMALLEYSAIAHPTAMLRKKVIEDFNLSYDTETEPAEDYDLWVRILRYGKIVNIPEVLLKYRLHEDQVSNVRRKVQKERAIKARKKMIEYLYDEVPEISVIEDITFGNNIKTNRTVLLQFLAEVKKAKILNRKRMFFPVFEFELFMEAKKRNAIQSFFKHPYIFGWTNLVFFLFNQNTFYRNFNNRDKVRVIIKNLITIRINYI